MYVCASIVIECYIEHLQYSPTFNFVVVRFTYYIQNAKKNRSLNEIASKNTLVCSASVCVWVFVISFIFN